MFNTSFSNKTQLKIKNIFFILLDRTRFNTFLALNRTDPTGTVMHAPLFMNFPAQEAANSASCNSVAVPQLTGGPTNKNLLLEYYQTSELLRFRSNHATNHPLYI